MPRETKSSFLPAIIAVADVADFPKLCALAPLREMFRLLCSRSLRSLHCYPLTFAWRAQTFGNLTAESRRTPS